MVALAFALIYSVAGEHIIALLTSIPSLQQLADRYLFWQMILPVIGVWCYLLDGMFIGATRGAEMRNSMAVAAAGFAVTLLSVPMLGNHGLWLALAVFPGFAWAFAGAHLAPPLAAWHPGLTHPPECKKARLSVARAGKNPPAFSIDLMVKKIPNNESVPALSSIVITMSGTKRAVNPPNDEDVMMNKDEISGNWKQLKGKSQGTVG